MVRGTVLAILVLALIASTIVGCTSTPSPAASPAAGATSAPAPQPTAAAQAEPIKLKAVSLLMRNDPSQTGFIEFAKRVTERAKGRLILEYAGGPEVIPQQDQPKAVQSGTIFLANPGLALYDKLVPGGPLYQVSQLTLQEERRPGGYGDTIQELYKKAGMYRLGYGLTSQVPPDVGMFTFHFVNKKVEKIGDLAGLKLTGYSRAQFPLATALGMVPMTTPPTEMYSALEKGIADAIVTTVLAYDSYGYHQVTKYTLSFLFYKLPNHNIVNLDVWNKLPKDLQDLMTQVQIELENEQNDLAMKQYNASRDAMIKAGMQFIDWSPADKQKFLDVANKVVVQQAITDYGEDLTMKILKTITKDGKIPDTWLAK